MHHHDHDADDGEGSQGLSRNLLMLAGKSSSTSTQAKKHKKRRVSNRGAVTLGVPKMIKKLSKKKSGNSSRKGTINNVSRERTANVSKMRKEDIVTINSFENHPSHDNHDLEVERITTAAEATK